MHTSGDERREGEGSTSVATLATLSSARSTLKKTMVAAAAAADTATMSAPAVPPSTADATATAQGSSLLQVYVRSHLHPTLFCVDAASDWSIAQLTASMLLTLRLELVTCGQLLASQVWFPIGGRHVSGDDLRTCEAIGVQHGATLQMHVRSSSSLCSGVLGGSDWNSVQDLGFGVDFSTMEIDQPEFQFAVAAQAEAAVAQPPARVYKWPYYTRGLRDGFQLPVEECFRKLLACNKKSFSDAQWAGEPVGDRFRSLHSDELQRSPRSEFALDDLRLTVLLALKECTVFWSEERLLRHIVAFELPILRVSGFRCWLTNLRVADLPLPGVINDAHHLPPGVRQGRLPSLPWRVSIAHAMVEACLHETYLSRLHVRELALQPELYNHKGLGTGDVERTSLQLTLALKGDLHA
jgi:hypothetical protein